MVQGRRVWLLIGVVLVSSGLALAQSPASSKFQEVSQHAADAFTQSKFDDAARLYREAVTLHPQWAEGWGYLAASLYALERYADAAEAYRRTTILTPKNGPSWAYLGFCEFELRRYRVAFDHLMKAQQLGLGDDRGLISRVHYELGLLWDTAGQFDMGTKELAFFPNVDDKTPIVIEATGLNVLRMPIFPYEIPAAQHDLIMKAGEAGWNENGHHVEEAKKIYEELIASYPKQPNLHFRYGIVLSLSDQEAAVSEMEKELEISPAYVPAMTDAAFLCLEMGQLEKSATLARRALELEPKNYAPHTILGRVLVQSGHLNEGIKELEEAVRLAPRIASAHFSLAQAYQKAGKGADATREFAAFKKLNQQREGQDAATTANP